jgi:hypothetical protein
LLLAVVLAAALGVAVNKLLHLAQRQVVMEAKRTAEQSAVMVAQRPAITVVVAVAVAILVDEVVVAGLVGRLEPVAGSQQIPMACKVLLDMP